MTTALEREAREESKSFAKRTFESGIAVDMGQIGASERGFYFGFKAAATLREKEIAYLSDARSRELQVLVKYLRQIKERDAEIATLRARVAELELEVEITAREALDRIAELEGMVPKWCGVQGLDRLRAIGWHVAVANWQDKPPMWLMVPPIPAPETKP